jgi:hypothetical protein
MSGIIAQNTLDSSGLIKSPEGGGAWSEIKSITLDGSSTTASFVHGASDVTLDSTYPIYCFQFINIHPSAEGSGDQHFTMNGSIDGGSNYNVAKTSTHLRHYIDEPGNVTNVNKWSDYDLGNETGAQVMASMLGAGNDEAYSGHMFLYNPGSTTFVKHYHSYMTGNFFSEYAVSDRPSGYFNTTSAIDAIQFGLTVAGNLDLHKIKLFGLKDS